MDGLDPLRSLVPLEHLAVLVKTKTETEIEIETERKKKTKPKKGFATINLFRKFTITVKF